MNASHRPPDRPDAHGPAPRLRPVSVTTDLEAPVDIDAVAAAAKLSPAEREAFARRVAQMREKLTRNAEQRTAFAADPFHAVGAAFKELKDPGILKQTLGPIGVDASCSSTQAAIDAIASCARSLLARTARWSAQSPANRAAMEANSDTAVDAVAAGYPTAAVVLVKAGLRAARGTP